MKATYYSNTSILVECLDKKILFDPWLKGRAYYGSWGMPELNLDFSIFDDLDYIHISHIHPDHLHEETLRELPDVPILIHKWDFKFVKKNLERLGKQVIELEHGAPFDIGNGISLTVYAADGCNPELCNQFFGCGKVSNPAKSVGIDTFSILNDGRYTLAQINDCPYELCKSILNTLPKIDCLFVGYTGASGYPQQFYRNRQIILDKYGPEKQKKTLEQGLAFLNHIKPKWYMPYAGTYTLVGKLGELEPYKGTPSRKEALDFYKKNYYGRGFLLEPRDGFILNSGQIIHNYKEGILNLNSKYDYEDDPPPNDIDLIELAKKAYLRFNKMKSELDYIPTTDVYIYLNHQLFKIPAIGEPQVVNSISSSRYISYKIDTRLLKRLLMGPQYAHFNNAEIGSHIEFEREPDIFERNLHYLMNYFHV